MLDINISLIVGQVVTFLIGLLALWHIAYKPITRIFKQRAEKIGADLDSAEKARRDMERLKADYEAQMARVAEETQNMMNKAVKEAQVIHDEIVNGAMEQSRIILARAQEHIELEKQKAVRDLRQQVTEISLLVAEKAIGETINRDLQRRLVDQLFTQVEANN
ncbi:MAG: F0F1 ATP synthase subunit B [Kiritimatiellae bacterium]|nr:F0F1 ATP synthase subunit B [Kiritimatiellia bacterium]